MFRNVRQRSSTCASRREWKLCDGIVIRCVRREWERADVKPIFQISRNGVLLAVIEHWPAYHHGGAVYARRVDAPQEPVHGFGFDQQCQLRLAIGQALRVAVGRIRAETFAGLGA